MRHRYLVCYDVSDPKRLRRVFRKMHGFGDPLQYSVFKCDLNDTERALMVSELSDLIHPRQDRVMIVKIGPLDEPVERRVEFMGKPLTPWQREHVVII